MYGYDKTPSLTITFKYLQIVSISGLLFNDKLSLDNHAALLAMSGFAPVSPGQKRSYAFIATQPGFFKYYCESIAVPACIFWNGWKYYS